MQEIVNSENRKPWTALVNKGQWTDGFRIKMTFKRQSI